LSGGNIDPLVLMKVLRHGMVAAGRFLQFQVRVRDTPGHLAALLQHLAALDANVLEVGHVRTNAGLAVDEVDIAVECEAKGPGHCAEVLAALEQVGYRVLERGRRSSPRARARACGGVRSAWVRARARRAGRVVGYGALG